MVAKGKGRTEKVEESKENFPDEKNELPLSPPPLVSQWSSYSSSIQIGISNFLNITIAGNNLTISIY